MLKEKIIKILEGTSLNSPVKKSELANTLNVSERLMRNEIETLRREGYPVIELGSGYFKARTPEEFWKGITHYKSYYKDMIITTQAMEESYKKMYEEFYLNKQEELF